MSHHPDLSELSTRELPSNESYYLDDIAEIQVRGLTKNSEHPRWQSIAHYIDKRTSLILVSGEEVLIDHCLSIIQDTILFVRYGAALPTISDDGLVLELVFTEAANALNRFVIADLTVSGAKQPKVWKSAELNLSWLAGATGYISISCQPGPENDPTADWLAISDLCLARQDLLPLYKAKSFQGLRAKNEIAHFSQVYKHEMYANTQNRLSQQAGGGVRSVRRLRVDTKHVHNTSEAQIQALDPLEGESPYGYASRLLATQIPQAAPDFLQRLKQSSADTKIYKVLSLCSGAARIEAGFAAQLENNVEWSLLDINGELLQRASTQFSPDVNLDLIEANVNELQTTGEKWDIILCVSALHHIVELEKLIKFCHQSLHPSGEFWSIGEYVGRNGNRLWPDAMEKANILFRELPKRYRMNRHSGMIDAKVPDNDYSVGCFEGIRSEDIEPILDSWFHPTDVLRRNCFLWRVINLAYSDNYDLSRDEDRHWIQQLVKHEVGHFRSGGRGTELFGVYSPRKFEFED